MVIGKQNYIKPAEEATSSRLEALVSGTNNDFLNQKRHNDVALEQRDNKKPKLD